MADFISSEGIHYNDSNDEFNFIVCVEEASNYDVDGEAGILSAKKETIKIFNPDQFEDAEDYALRLVKSLPEFTKGSLVSLSTHKKLFDLVL